MREVVAELPATPVAGSGKVAENLADRVDRSVVLHEGSTPAFADMMSKPEALARFDDLPDARVAGNRPAICAPSSAPDSWLLPGDPNHAEVPPDFARGLVRTLSCGTAGAENPS